MSYIFHKYKNQNMYQCKKTQIYHQIIKNVFK